MKKPYPLVLAALAVCAAACDPQSDAPKFPVSEVEGYEPIYAPHDDQPIAFIAPQPVQNPGKIFIISNYLLVNERYKGIHVFDNADPRHPEALGFLRIAGNTELSQRNSVLYVDHLNDLVALNVTDWNHIKELSRIPQANWTRSLPPGEGKYFICPDPNQAVVGWKLATLHNPKCYR